MAKTSNTPSHSSARELLCVDPDTFSRADVDPGAIVAGPTDKEAARAECTALEESVSELHDRLFAAARRTGSRHRLLILLQGMDTSGKDGAARRKRRASVRAEWCAVCPAWIWEDRLTRKRHAADAIRERDRSRPSGGRGFGPEEVTNELANRRHRA